MKIIPRFFLLSLSPIIRQNKHQGIVFYRDAMSVHQMTAVVFNPLRLVSIIVHGTILVIVHLPLIVRF